MKRTFGWNILWQALALVLLAGPAVNAIAAEVKLYCDLEDNASFKHQVTYQFDTVARTVEGHPIGQQIPENSSNDGWYKVYAISDAIITFTDYSSTGEIRFMTEINRVTGAYRKWGARDGRELTTGHCAPLKQAF